MTLPSIARLLLLAFSLCILPKTTWASSTEPIRGTFWLVHSNATQGEVEARADALARSGINVTFIGGRDHHYLHNHLPFIERYITNAQQIVAACHARGIKVVEHHSVVLTTRREYVEQYPEWIQRDFTTGKASVWPEYGTYAFCPNNAEFREHYWKIARDIVKRTGVDGLMSDDTVFHHGCCCPACTKRWKDEVGGDIREAYEKSRKSGTQEWRTFNEVRRRWYEDFRDWLRRRQKKEFPGKPCVALIGSITSPWGSQTHGGCVEGGLNTGDIGVWEPYNPADFYSWRRLSAEAAAQAEAARVRSAIMTCIPYADTAVKRDAFDPEEETFMWALLQAHGISFTLSRVFLTGLIAGDTPREYFLFERDRLKVCRGSEPAATIGILFSHRSRDNDPAWETWHSAPTIAWGEALTDVFVPWRAVTEETLDKSLPSDLKTLILPNVFSLSDRHLNKIERFVRRGGTLIASYLPATFDETGESRLEVRRSRLEKLFGVRLKSAVLPAPTSAAPRTDFDIISAREFRNDPDIYMHKFGKGSTCYIPSLIERSAFQDWMNEGQPFSDPRKSNVVRVLTALVTNVTPAQPVYISCVNAKAGLATTVRRVGNKLLIYVLNTGGADLPGGATVPSPSKVVWAEPADITLSFAKSPKALRLISLDTQEDKIVQKPGKTATLRAPKRFAVIVIDH